MKIFIQNNPAYNPIIKYTLQVFAANKKIRIDFVNDPQAADLNIDETEHSELPVALHFYQGLKKKEFRYDNYFKKDCLVYTKDEKPDLIATCYYMMNSLQEYEAVNYDEIGRFTLSNSYQHKFNNITQNLVQHYFDKLARDSKFSKETTTSEH